MRFLSDPWANRDLPSFHGIIEGKLHRYKEKLPTRYILIGTTNHALKSNTKTPASDPWLRCKLFLLEEVDGRRSTTYRWHPQAGGWCPESVTWSTQFFTSKQSLFTILASSGQHPPAVDAICTTSRCSRLSPSWVTCISLSAVILS